MRKPRVNVMIRRVAAVAVGLAAMSALAFGESFPEFVFEEAPFASCHASTIVELRNGDLQAAWFGGSGEGKPDVAIWASRRSQGRWSAPVELAREPGIASFNPVLFYTKNGRLWLYYKFGGTPQVWNAARAFSLDDGQTWSPPEHLAAGLYGPIRAKPLLLGNGEVISGTSVESYARWDLWIERSRDDGLTFQKVGPIALPPDQNGETNAGRPSGLIQPSVVLLGGKHLRLYARSSSQIGKICVADSFDLGLTWTAARRLELPNPNSGIDAVALRDGRVVLVYNNTTSGRTPLNLGVSRDGEHFTMFRALETEAGEYSYPAMVQARNGDLLITYTWNRKRIRFIRLPLSEIPPV